MRRISRFFPVSLALSLTAAAGLATSCGHDHDHEVSTEVDEYFYDCEDAKRPTTLTVFATDESLVKMLEKEDAGGIITRDEEAVALLAPASGATVSAATAPTFTLMPPATSARGQEPAPMFQLEQPALRRRSFWRRALTWLSPVGTAWAHCTPVTGDNYLLRLAGSDGKQIYAALISTTTFTPGAEVWKKSIAAVSGQTLKVTLLRASYSGGTITAGPFVGSKPITFVAGP
jgi:hypothetical protein